MNTSLESAVDELRRLEDSALERYRALAPQVAGPAERRLAESVIDRKGSHASKLAALAKSPVGLLVELPDGWPFPPPAPAGAAAAEPASALLSLLRDEESALSRSYSALADATAGAAPETAFALRSLADSSGKFALWAEEHLELLGLG
ncbi:MAG: hypothetical protein JXA15_13195 [Spirochaetales bacterium]|nr:hypothetical protein [Spirochaetales bacterium]